MFNNIKYFILQKCYNLKYGIINLITWLPIIWNDRNYGEYYLLKIIDYKLCLIVKEMNNSLIEFDKEEVSIINSIRDAIVRINNNDYCREERNKHTELYGELIFRLNNDSNKIDLIYSKADTKEQEDLGNKNLFYILKLEEERKKQDINFVFNTIRDNIYKWWV